MGAEPRAVTSSAIRTDQTGGDLARAARTVFRAPRRELQSSRNERHRWAPVRAVPEAVVPRAALQRTMARHTWCRRLSAAARAELQRPTTGRARTARSETGRSLPPTLAASATLPDGAGDAGDEQQLHRRRRASERPGAAAAGRAGGAGAGASVLLASGLLLFAMMATPAGGDVSSPKRWVVRHGFGTADVRFSRIAPVERFPATHPKVLGACTGTASGVDAGQMCDLDAATDSTAACPTGCAAQGVCGGVGGTAAPDRLIRPTDGWSTGGRVNAGDDSCAEVTGAEAFFAHNFPESSRSNSGFEEYDTEAVVLLADTNGAGYLLLNHDKPGNLDGGRTNVIIDSPSLAVRPPSVCAIDLV